MVRGRGFPPEIAVRRVFAVAFSAVLAAAVGCSGSTDQPELGLVSGTVTLNGTPLTDVDVTFRPGDGRPAMGKTDAAGHYQLTYIRDTPGCKVGRSRVEIGNSEESESEDESGSELEGDELIQTPNKAGAPEIPARYNVNSELEADVKPGENTFNFDLKS